MSRTVLRRALVSAFVITLCLVTVLVFTSVNGARQARAAGQEIDPSYANGTTVYMIGPHMNTNPNPNLLAQAPHLYILAYPVNSSGCTSNCPLVTLPSGYQPQCDPCFHPGLPPVFAYHDHVLTGAPGFGNNGTAGSFKGPWQIIVMMYNPAVAMSPSFQPIKSDEDLDKAEAAGEFLPIGGGANPYEIATGVVLICPLVSSHA
ncbi:MAG TPA: hypothetical protein VF116_21690 [Ktedonobacterales bacterium]